MTENLGMGMELALPDTGEMVSLENIARGKWVVPYDDPLTCALSFEQIRKIEQVLRDVKTEIKAALTFESERVGSKTLHLPGGVKVEIKTNNVVEWDYDRLRDLLDAGLPESRYKDLVREKTEYSVSVRVADQLSRANPEYARIIELARTPLEAKHSVSVVSS